MTNIILCGGNGTRLWPLSRTLMPKQFLKLFTKETPDGRFESKSLFQLTVERNSKLCDSNFIVSNAEQYFLAVDQMEENNSTLNIKNSQFLLEPIGRNTAPAIALACLQLDPNEIVLVTPSDHLIKNTKEYEKVILKAKELAKENTLVTFGITPAFPQTGFGYIEGCQVSDEDDALDVIAFHEKPNASTAKKYLSHNSQSPTPNTQFFWNSGMFCFKAGVFLDELKKHSPEIYDASKKAINPQPSTPNPQTPTRITHEDMIKIPDDSIDYAVMEKSSKVKVVPSDINWSDLGSFDALYDELPKDETGNTINKNHINIDSKNNLIYGNERKIATVDIEDLIIIDTGDALLVSKKGSSQKIKKAVNLVKLNSELHNIHLTVNRPWGTFTVLEDEDEYKVKRLVVKPGCRLSLQKHMNRSEHWTVVYGTAVVSIDNEEKVLVRNESTYIPIGSLHRLENNGKVDLVVLEVQIGDYLGEDDIIRYEDDYKRD